MKKKIFVTTEFVGLHHWPEAPKEVEFLRNIHRHRFKVRAEIESFHNDRELEFFMVQSFINSVIEKSVKRMKKRRSCEDMAELILKKLQEKYGDHREYSVEVNEDGENGAILSTNKSQV